MARQTRSDCTIGTFEKKNGLPEGTLRHKTIDSVRRDDKKKGGKR